MVNDGCNDCDQINGTYILSQCESNPCTYSDEFTMPCGFTMIRAGLDTSGVWFSVYAFITGGLPRCSFEAGSPAMGRGRTFYVTGPQDCMDKLDGLELTDIGISQMCTGGTWVVTGIQT